MVSVDSIKKRLRINHDKLDTQFEEDISAAKQELARVGVMPKAIEEGSPLIDKAIIAYVMWIESDSEKAAAGYKEQWDQWRDELRKSPGYGYEVAECTTI